jgi:hypothetical protein
MSHRRRTVIDARTDPPTITTVPGTAGTVSLRTGSELVRPVSRTTVRAAGRRRLVLVATATGPALFIVLGTAGYLLGTSALGAAIAVGVIVVAALILTVLYLATRPSGSHCPGAFHR